MTIEQINSIMSACNKYHKTDSFVDKGLEALCKAIAPAQYAIFSEHSLLEAFVKGIEFLDIDLWEDIMRYYYDAQSLPMEDRTVITKDGWKTYKITSLSSFKEYLYDTYCNDL